MSHPVQPLSIKYQQNPWLQTGIIEDQLPEGMMTVRCDQPGPLRQIHAQAAVMDDDLLQIGDKVIVMLESPSSGYVIGRLAAVAASGQKRPVIRTANGATARVSAVDGEQAIEVRDREHQLVFRYHPDSGHATVNVPDGNLAMSVPNGSIDLKAGGPIGLHSGQAVTLTEGQTDGAGPQQLQLNHRGMVLNTRDLNVTTASADLVSGRTRFSGQRISATVGQVRLVCQRLESRVHQLIERAHDAYRSVRRLLQIRSGRMRTLVDGAHHVKSRRSTMIAEEQLRMDAKKINLG